MYQYFFMKTPTTFCLHKVKMPTFFHYCFDFSESGRNDNVTMKCSDLTKYFEVTGMQYFKHSTTTKSFWAFLCLILLWC